MWLTCSSCCLPLWAGWWGCGCTTAICPYTFSFLAFSLLTSVHSPLTCLPSPILSLSPIHASQPAPAPHLSFPTHSPNLLHLYHCASTIPCPPLIQYFTMFLSLQLLSSRVTSARLRPCPGAASWVLTSGRSACQFCRTPTHQKVCCSGNLPCSVSKPPKSASNMSNMSNVSRDVLHDPIISMIEGGEAKELRFSNVLKQACLCLGSHSCHSFKAHARPRNLPHAPSHCATHSLSPSLSFLFFLPCP